MRQIIRYFHWELNNEFVASAYFAVILLMYCIIKLILGAKNIDILVVIEMFLTIYALSTLQKLILDHEKEYDEKTFILRAAFISVISILVIVAVSVIGGWFVGMPFWAAITIYTVLIISYLTVWMITKLSKKYDTERLNEQLANYKRKTKLNQEVGE